LIEDTPSKETIQHWLQTDRYTVRRFFNTSGIRYREMGLKDKVDSLSHEEAAELLSSDGMLIKRPVLITNGLIQLGFKVSEYELLFGKEEGK